MNTNEEKRWGRILGILAAGVAATFAMQACNTTEGMGQDIQDLGENIEEEADENK